MVPFCNLPILEVDDQPLFHSVAISQYLGKLVGLLPFNDWEFAELDAIVDVTYELGWRKYPLINSTEMIVDYYGHILALGINLVSQYVSSP